jgi:ammonium transporter Rh
MGKNIYKKLMVLAIFLFGTMLSSFAQVAESSTIHSILEVQQYNRAIHIMAMLLLGFGFLMVFMKKYGRSAITATFLLVSVALPMYFAISGMHVFEEKAEIEKLILAEFGAASLLIATGALLGRIKLFQYIILGLLFIHLEPYSASLQQCFYLKRNNVRLQ